MALQYFFVMITIMTTMNLYSITSTTASVSTTTTTTSPLVTTTSTTTPAVTTPAVVTPAVVTPAVVTPAVVTPATTPTTPPVVTPAAVVAPAPATSAPVVATTPAAPAQPSSPTPATPEVAAAPVADPKVKQILISIYIQNNYEQQATLSSIELVLADQNHPVVKNNLKIAIKGSSLYSKGTITAFDITTESQTIDNFSGIKSVTINNDVITFDNIKTGSTLSNPIKITKKDGHWIVNK